MFVRSLALFYILLFSSIFVWGFAILFIVLIYHSCYKILINVFKPCTVWGGGLYDVAAFLDRSSRSAVNMLVNCCFCKASVLQPADGNSSHKLSRLPGQDQCGTDDDWAWGERYILLHCLSAVVGKWDLVQSFYGQMLLFGLNKVQVTCNMSPPIQSVALLPT